MTKEQRARGKKYERLIKSLDDPMTRINALKFAAEQKKSLAEGFHLDMALKQIEVAAYWIKEAVKRCGEDHG